MSVLPVHLPTTPTPHICKSILNICVSIPALQVRWLCCVNVLYGLMCVEQNLCLLYTMFAGQLIWDSLILTCG